MSTQPSSTHETDIPTHHEYDGIVEFNNPLPMWWLFTFFITIFFALGYWFHYHALRSGPSSGEVYAAAMQEREAQARARDEKLAASLTDDALSAMAKDPAKVEEGKQLFATNCVACHAAQGQGLIGANLTDAWWIHGGKPTQIYKIINEGVLTKGMPTWRDALGASKVMAVTAYVLTLKGTNVAGKAAEGLDEAGAPAPVAAAPVAPEAASAAPM